MLGNRLYRGEIVHRERSYPGVHDALIGDDLWQAVQRRLEANRHDRKTGSAARQPSLLAGLVRDETGAPMTPTHATGNPTRYRYYVSRDLIGKGRPRVPRGRRVPAGDLEPLVEDRLCRFLGSRARVFAAIEAHRPGAGDRARLLARAAGLARSSAGRPWSLPGSGRSCSACSTASIFCPRASRYASPPIDCSRSSMKTPFHRLRGRSGTGPGRSLR